MSEHDSYERLRASLDDAYEQADQLVREAEAQARQNARDVLPRVANRLVTKARHQRIPNEHAWH